MPRLSIAFLGTASIAAAAPAIIQVQAVHSPSVRAEPAAHSVSEVAPSGAAHSGRGPIRMINMMQSLGKFIVLTWSATFLHSVCERAWRE
jgi:hypothetical protein